MRPTKKREIQEDRTNRPGKRLGGDDVITQRTGSQWRSLSALIEGHPRLSSSHQPVDIPPYYYVTILQRYYPFINRDHATQLSGLYDCLMQLRLGYHTCTYYGYRGRSTEYGVPPWYFYSASKSETSKAVKIHSIDYVLISSIPQEIINLVQGYSSLIPLILK